MSTPKSSRRRSVILRTIYALCLAGATFNHATNVAEHGLFWDYGGFPRASTIFWTALTAIDPLAIVLLLLRPNLGVLATAAIIVVDVIHNVWITARYFPPLLHGLAGAPAVLEQIGFMIFVLGTVHWAVSRPVGSSLRAGRRPRRTSGRTSG